MTQRMTINRSDSVKVYAFSGRECLGSRFDSFDNVAQCISAAQQIADRNHSTLTEVEVVNDTKELSAFYTPNGKRKA